MSLLRNFYVILIFIFFTCEKPPSPLSYSERKRADSIYSELRKRQQAELDSICSHIRMVEFSSMYDSIMKQRILTIHKLKPKVLE